MLPLHVALVSETDQLDLSEVSSVSAAIQKQVIRDFGPIWEIEATVDAFGRLEDVPTDYWQVIVKDDIDTPGAAGVHEDKDGQPFALVQFSDEWTLTTSHEVLEMLADPFGNRLIAGQSVKRGQGRVQYLVEVCDPSEDSQFAYTINGITVSDFYTPNFFDPVTAESVRYSFSGAITAPRQVLKGGYLSWHDPASDHWFQQVFFTGNKPTFRDLGVLSASGKSLREMIDSMTPRPDEVKAVSGKAKPLAGARAVGATHRAAMTGRAKAMRATIEEIMREYE